MRKIYLDDIRTPQESENWIIVRSYDEFVAEIKVNGIPDFISFDHDLGSFDYEEQKNGYDCAKFLGDYIMNTKTPEYTGGFIDYHVHSMNPVGKENIEKYMHRLNIEISNR